MMQTIVLMMAFSLMKTVPADSVRSAVVVMVSGDIEVDITATDVAAVSSDEDFDFKVYDDTMKIIGTSGDVNLTLPPTVNLNFKSVSGDIEIDYDPSSDGYPEYIDLGTVSGDVSIYNLPPAQLKVVTISGDVEIHDYAVADSGAWAGVNDTITTTSGYVFLEKCVPAIFYISSFSDAVEIDDADSLCKMLGNYTIKSNDVSIDSSVALNFAQLIVESKGGGLSEEGEEVKSQQKLSSFLDLWHPSAGVFSFNRVQGLVLGIGTHMQNEHEYAGIKARDEIALGARYAFSLKKWDLWLGIQKSLFSPLFIGFRTHSMVLTPDMWKLEGYDNSLQAFLLNTDVFDYYFSRAMLGGGGISFLPYGELFAGYEIENISSLCKHTDWSLFYPRRPFRENPQVTSQGEYRWLIGHLSAVFGPMKADARLRKSILTPSGNEILNLVAQLRAKISIQNSEFGVKVTGGYSNSTDFPFGFKLGGIGTLPGYELNSIETDRFILIQGEYRAEFNAVDGIIFTDIARTYSEEPDLHYDAGVGIGTGPLSLLVAHAIERDMPTRIIFRFSKRI